MTTSPLIGLVAPRDHERWIWEQTLHQAGLSLLVCHAEQMTSLHPAAWVVALPVHLPPDLVVGALHVTAPTLMITPWLAETRRLVGIYQPVHPVMVVYPDHARRHVRRYLTLLAHTHSGVLTVPARLNGAAS